MACDFRLGRSPMVGRGAHMANHRGGPGDGGVIAVTPGAALSKRAVVTRPLSVVCPHTKQNTRTHTHPQTKLSRYAFYSKFRKAVAAVAFPMAAAASAAGAAAAGNLQSGSRNLQFRGHRNNVIFLCLRLYLGFCFAFESRRQYYEAGNINYFHYKYISKEL